MSSLVVYHRERVDAGPVCRKFVLCWCAWTTITSSGRIALLLQLVWSVIMMRRTMVSVAPLTSWCETAAVESTILTCCLWSIWHKIQTQLLYRLTPQLERGLTNDTQLHISVSCSFAYSFLVKVSHFFSENCDFSWSFTPLNFFTLSKNFHQTPKIYRQNFETVCHSSRDISISGFGGHMAICLFPVIGYFRSRQVTPSHSFRFHRSRISKDLFSSMKVCPSICDNDQKPKRNYSCFRANLTVSGCPSLR